ncbi:MAG: DUF3419 family protein [Planctomycetota bacterium]
MPREAKAHRDFTQLRYAQCWEDADVLLEALDIQPGQACLSIASAGDNTLSLLTADPNRVVAIDLSPAQLACLALRVAAYRSLEHSELLELIGSVDSDQRPKLYERCRRELASDARAYWDTHPKEIARGIGDAGKFEAYFRTFRRRILPWVHSGRSVQRLLAGGDRSAREQFYEQTWNSRRWRWLFRAFFSRRVMGWLGRSPAFFRYVDGPVAPRILARARHALVELDPADNPYLHWILTGRHRVGPDAKSTVLPHALRREHFDAIRTRLDRLTWRRASLEDALEDQTLGPIDRYNLSDIFEYVSADQHARQLARMVDRSPAGTRWVYWNMLAPRARPESLAGRVASHDALAHRLHAQDNAFFYNRLVIEQVRP